MSGVIGGLLEGNLFDHNGWNAAVSGADPTIFNHNMYLQYTNAGVIVINNISADRFFPFHLVYREARNGGLIENNLFVNDPIALLVGNTSSEPSDNTVVSGNVILNGSDIMTTPVPTPRAFGIQINPTPSTIIEGNIIADSMSSEPYGDAIEVDGGTSNKVVSNVIYNWTGGIVDLTNAATIGAGQVYTAGLTDPTRSIASYMTSLGGTPSWDAFLAAAEQQSESNWNSAYTASAVNAYIQAGFTPVVLTPQGAKRN